MTDPQQAKRPQRAGIYCRLSYAPDGSLEKVERQEADCRELAVRLSWPVSEEHVFPDNSRSAWQRNRQRPQWDRMLKAIDAGEIDAVIVYHGDRLIRQPYDLETMIGIADQKGIRIASPSGTRDLDNADDRFILRIEAAQACKESDNISRRVRRALKSRAEVGLTTGGGRRPFGWGVQTGTRTKIDRESGEEITVPVLDTSQPVPEEIRFLADGAERMLAGMAQAAVVRWLNEEGCTTSEGNPWTTKSWRNLMLSPRIAGLIEHEGALCKAAWKGAISAETWEDIKRLYKDSAESHPYPGRARKYLLTGGAECYRCHVPERGQSGSEDVPACKGTACAGPHQTVQTKPSGGRNRKTSRIYYCPACRGIGRNLELLDGYVEGRTLKLLANPEFAKELQAASADGNSQLQDQITALERRKTETQKQLKDLADHPDVDPGLAVLAVASFDRKITQLRSQMASSAKLRRLARMVGISQQVWTEHPIDVRATVVRDLYRVVILPTERRGPGFDPATVRLERRPLAAA